MTTGELMTHEITTKILTGGKITIPKTIRDIEQVEEGDIVKVVFIGILGKKAIR